MKTIAFIIAVVVTAFIAVIIFAATQSIDITAAWFVVMQFGTFIVVKSTKS